LVYCINERTPIRTVCTITIWMGRENRMATKFITIRIPIPSLSWFHKEETLHEPKTDAFARNAEIKARIAALRSSLEQSQKPVETAQAQPKHVVAEEPQQTPRDTDREQKARELNAMKAKLLGKKK